MGEQRIYASGDIRGILEPKFKAITGQVFYYQKRKGR